MPQDLPYRDFHYPLNVFMYILTREEGSVPYLHYGIFDSPSDPILVAQQRSTDLLVEYLPSPPATILEVGIGLGTTLARLVRQGYTATGITPDRSQIAMIRERYGDELNVLESTFEQYDPGAGFDCLVFQESSQYIEAGALFARARSLAPLVVVADEFALQPVDAPGALHSLVHFLEAARSNGFELLDEIDLSMRAAPSVSYFVDRLPRYRAALVADLGLHSAQVDELITSGGQYAERYRAGVYGYRLLTFRASRVQSAAER